MPSDKPLFIAAYDTESTNGCREALENILPIHAERSIPATVFLVSRLLEGTETGPYRKLLQPAWIEVGSHTATHPLLRPHPLVPEKTPPSPDVIRHELTHSRLKIESILGKKCIGLRTPVGFTDGLGTDPAFLRMVTDAGYTYSSSQSWGPHCSLPAPLCQARHYGDQGFPSLWEFPCHGWHENVLKGRSLNLPAKLLLWPSPYPEAVTRGIVTTPEEEFEVYRYFVDRAIEDNLEYITPIWHPWSLGEFDPECRMLHLLFDYAAECGCTFGTFADLRARR